jgi:hypothetical protein
MMGGGLGSEGQKWLRNPKCLSYRSARYKKRFWFFCWASIFGGRPYRVPASRNGFMEAVALRQPPPKIEDF